MKFSILIVHGDGSDLFFSPGGWDKKRIKKETDFQILNCREEIREIRIWNYGCHKPYPCIDYRKSTGEWLLMTGYGIKCYKNLGSALNQLERMNKDL